MELATKNAFLLLTLINPGKHQVKNMDIFLQPLVDELKYFGLLDLWCGIYQDPRRITQGCMEF